MSLKKNIKHLNYILKLGKVLSRGSQRAERDEVMRYILTFLNNSVNTMGFIVEDDEIVEI